MSRETRASAGEPSGGGGGRRKWPLPPLPSAHEHEHKHVSAEWMARWLQEYADEPVGRQFIEHLVENCPACRANHEELERLAGEVRHWDLQVAVFEGRQAPELWEVVAALPAAERLERVRVDDELHTWGLCRLLQRRSLEVLGERPEEAELLIEMALAAWRGIAGLSAYGAESLADLRAELLACRAAVRRVLGELHAADADCREAAVALGEGTGDPAVAAGIKLLTAPLRRDQGRGEEALALLARAFEVYSQVMAGERERHLAGETLATRAWCLRLEDRAAEALPVLGEALTWIEERKNRRLARGIRGERVGCLLATGRSEEAAAAAANLASSVESLGGDALDRARALRAVGQAAAARESWEEAEAALAAAASELRRSGQGEEAALTLIALGGVRTAQGGDPVPLAAELAAAIAAPAAATRLQAKQVVTLFAWRDACLERSLTPALAQQLVARFERQGMGRLLWSPSLR